ncbi:replicative DNA helicase [Xanthomonas citri]|uniref:replicative DNA helicase n=1 Tax=Xanthomonas citri TaxID=346 RepID=UPI0010E353AC|nr:replicative DNA helicase [Xanthomonas citri]MCC8492311.1 replicative DNA helicase [Xanthomonas citri pv. fuscans]TBW96698.1 hypothetical protein TP49_11800 [Xanthomonas citri pv. aurantifolii]TBX03210.1 hypothetical protein TP46_12295 [Xanthomonas citri pv. aurantifolii]
MSSNIAEFPMDAGRSLPCAIDAESYVLGGLMLDNSSLPKVSDWLKPEDFIRADHQAIYLAILALAAGEKPFDAVTVCDCVDDQVASLVLSIVADSFSAANVVAYAEIVKSKATQRQLIEIGQGIVDSGFAPDGRDVSEIVADATMSLSELSSVRRGALKPAKMVGKAWFDELRRRYELQGEMVGLPTPWSGFNRMTNGLKDGELIVVAARPSMGKSAWAVNVATSVALRGKRALIFSLEMTDTSIFNRAVSSISEVPLSWLQRPNNEHESYWARSADAARDLNNSGLMIDETSGLSAPQIVARCRRERMRGDVSLVIIDHLHLMPLPGKTRETVEIGHITAAFKKMAKELGCPVILLSQLNRSLETRANKRPQMADLRESGNIEQDADLIVFLYRDDYYADREGRTSPLAGFVEMIVAKQREGQTGTAWARNELRLGRIGDYDGDAPSIEVTAKGRSTRGLD